MSAARNTIGFITVYHDPASGSLYAKRTGPLSKNHEFVARFASFAGRDNAYREARDDLFGALESMGLSVN